MFLQYGNYVHPIAEAAVVINRQALHSTIGEFYAIKERWDISGFLQAADQPSLNAAMNAMQAAYGIQGQSIGLFFDNGNPSFHGVLAGNTLGGPMVVVQPTFPQGMGAEYSTFRSYNIAVEWELPIAGNVVLEFHETLEFIGDGGPKFGFLQPVNGFPQRQLLAEATPQKIIQRGFAVGYLSYPAPMLPFFPDALHREASRVWRDNPERRGPIGSPIWRDFRVNWVYDHELTVGIGIFGEPNRAIN